MSPDQRGMCFAEWKKCWAAMKAGPAESFVVDEKTARMMITRKAIGVEKSWGDAWGQKQIDWLLAIMWAISASDNLTLQLRQVDQPLTRMEGSAWAQTYLDAIRDGADERGEVELVERLSAPGGRESYIGGICQRIHKKPLCDIDDAGWQDILAALNHTRLHKLGIGHTHKKKGPKPPGSEHNVHSDVHSPAAASPSRTGAPVKGNPF